MFFTNTLTDSEFIISNKKLINSKSSSKLKDSIARSSGNILKEDLSLNKFSINLREFLLNQFEDSIYDNENSFFKKAKRSDLVKSLHEIEKFEEYFKKTILDLEKKLASLKKNFELN